MNKLFQSYSKKKKPAKIVISSPYNFQHINGFSNHQQLLDLNQQTLTVFGSPTEDRDEILEDIEMEDWTTLVIVDSMEDVPLDYKEKHLHSSTSSCNVLGMLDHSKQA